MASYIAFFCLVLSPLALAFSPSLHLNTFDVRGERDLRKDLFGNYDKEARPVKRYSDAVPVNISMTPLSINHLDLYHQHLTMDSWIMMAWIDEYLKWDPEDYDGITELHVSPTEIWRPDISLYTASPDTAFFPKIQTKAIVYSSGKVLWVPPFTVENRCPLPSGSVDADKKSYIECNIKMGSWTYSIKMLNLQLANDTVDLSTFIDSNKDWKLVKVASNRLVYYYDCCSDGYPAVNFNITLKRRDGSFGRTLLDDTVNSAPLL